MKNDRRYIHCLRCQDQGILLLNAKTDDQRTVAYAYRCDCPEGERRPRLPLAPPRNGVP